MATLTIGGKRVKVSDSFLKLSPEEQQRTANQIASQIGVGAPAASPDTGLATMDSPPEGAVPGSPAYAKWAAARARAGKRLPPVEGSQHFDSDPNRNLIGGTSAFIAEAADKVPIVGRKLREGLEAGRAAVQGMSPEEVAAETARVIEANPVASTSGAITGTVAPFVLASTLPVVSTILGVDVGAPLAVNMVAGAASQKAISHFDTLARGGDPNETVNIGGVEMKPEDIASIAGVAGPIVGKAIGAGANAVNQNLIQPVVRAVKGATGGIGDLADATISRAVAADLTSGRPVMSAADEAAAAAAGQPIINADRFGNATRQLARTAANVDPVVAGELSELTQSRFLTQNARAKDWVTRNTGAPTNVYAVQQALGATKKAVNNPAYKKAYTAPGADAIWTPEIQQLMGSENFRKAINAAVKSSNEEAVLSGTKPIVNPFVVDPKTGAYRLRLDASGKPIQPTLEFWDHVQRQLRQKASKLAQQGKSFDAGQVYRARGQLNDVLDTTVPEFATARGGAASFFGAEDALEAGQKFVTMQSSDIPAARAAFAKFTPTERRLFSSGFASSLLNKIDDLKDGTDVINQVFTSPRSRAQIELALGPKAVAELEPFLRVENVMNLTKRVIQGGSNTAQQQMMLGLLQQGGTNLGIGYGAGTAFGGLDPRNWGTKAWTVAALAAAGRAGARALGRSVDQKVMQKVAEALASGDKTLIEEAVKRASRSPGGMSAIQAIENGLSTLVKSAGLGAGAGAAQETTP